MKKDSVKADDVEARLKAARDAVRALRDKSELFEEGGDVRLGPRHRFSVNTQELDLTLMPRARRVPVHLTGTDFLEPLQDPRLDELRGFWQVNLESESETLYRAEYLAGEVLAAADAAAMASAWSACRRCWRSRTSWRDPRFRRAALQGLRERYSRPRCGGDPGSPAAIARECRTAALRAFGEGLRQPVLEPPARERKSPAGPSGHAAAAASSRCSVVTTACSPFAAKWPRRCVRCSPNSPSRWTRSISTRRPSTWSGSCPPSVPNSPSANMPGNCRKDSSCACKARVYGTTTGRPWAPRRAARRPVGAGRQLAARTMRRRRVRAAGGLPGRGGGALVAGRGDATTDHRGRPALPGRRPDGRASAHRRTRPGAGGGRLLRPPASPAPAIPAGAAALPGAAQEIVEHEREALRLAEFKPRPLSSFVRNKLINDVYLGVIGDNLAKQMGTVGEKAHRPDGPADADLPARLRQDHPDGVRGAPPGADLHEDQRSCPRPRGALALDPGQAPDATSRQELEKLNLALEMGNNVMLYVDDIQHTHPEFLQKFISLSTARARAGGGVWKGRTKTYDMRGRKFCVVIYSNFICL